MDFVVAAKMFWFAGDDNDNDDGYNITCSTNCIYRTAETLHTV
jgi:hypothetical protein